MIDIRPGAATEPPFQHMRRDGDAGSAHAERQRQDVVLSRRSSPSTRARAIRSQWASRKVVAETGLIG